MLTEDRMKYEAFPLPDIPPWWGVCARLTPTSMPRPVAGPATESEAHAMQWMLDALASGCEVFARRPGDATYHPYEGFLP